MKTQLSSLDIRFLVKELSSLVGTRIDKVFQIGERDIKIDLRGRGEKLEMIIAPSYMCLTKFKYETPKTPSNLAMILRKKIGNGIITSVNQRRFDRIVEIEIENRGTLIIELFSRGNIILLDRNRIIENILEGQNWKDRTLRVGEEYRYPPETPDIGNMSLKEFAVILADKKDIVRIIASNLGLGASYANELLERLEIDPETRVSREQSEKIYNALNELLESKIEPYLFIGDDLEDVTPFDMVSYSNLDKEKKANFNEAVDEYFTKIRTEGIKKESTKDYDAEVTRVSKVVERQSKSINSLEDDIEKFKAMGDKIYANYQEIDDILKGVKEAKTKGINWMRYLESKNLPVTEPALRKFEFDGVGIFIDKKVTDNATIYYDKSKKAKDKLEGATAALRRSKRDLTKVDESKLKAEKKLPDGPIERHVPEWYEKFRWFMSSDGFLVIGGRDATTNEMLIKKHLDANDLVFHSTVHGAPFFIIKNPEGVEIPANTKREAAEGAASYSSAWNSEWGNADVYAVKPDQVSKTPNSGEYLSKGAFVIRGEREWFKGTPLKIALGFRVTDYAISIGGPESAVASQAKNYVKIGVGSMKSGLLAKEAKAQILRQTNKEDGQKIKKVIIGEIQRWIPAGKGMLLK